MQVFFQELDLASMRMRQNEQSLDFELDTDFELLIFQILVSLAWLEQLCSI